MPCEVCCAPVTQPVSKFGKPYGRPKRFCSDRCRYAAKRVANRVESWCHYCGMWFSRDASGQDAVKYCSRACYEQKKARIKLEAAALRRIAEAWHVAVPVVREPGIVSIEVAGIRRLGRLTKKCKTVRPCRGGCEGESTPKNRGPPPSISHPLLHCRSDKRTLDCFGHACHLLPKG